MSLQSIIQQIKSATLPGENTALRVGSALEQMDAVKRDITDSLSASDTIDMINAVKLLAATGTPFLGTIDPATVIPAGNFWAFAGEGTYANAGGIVVGAGEIAIITRVGATFDSVILDVPVKSIEDIEKTSTVGLVDTYTITYTDGSTPTTFDVTNGNSVTVIDGFASSSTTAAGSAKNDKILNDIINANFVDKYSYIEFYDTATVQNGYYNASGVFTANADFRATPKINVVAGTIWRYRGKPYTSLSIRGVYGFRANGTVVVLVDVVNAINFVEFTIPSDVIQIAANYNVSTGTYFNLQRVDVTQVLVSISKDTLGNVQTINNENVFKTFTGKSIGSVGDSITANGVGGSLKGYQLVLQDYFSFTNYTTYGYSGQPLSTYITPNGATIIEMFINNAVSKDIYTLLAGTNDFKLNMRNGAIGTLTDYINLTSYGSVGSVISLNFYQALKAFVLRCYELNPKAKIIFITPLQRDNAGYTSWSTNPVGRTLSDFVNAIREVAAYESIPVVDLFKEGTINIRNIAQYTSDGLHPNNDGYVLLGNLIKPAIFKIL